MNGQEAHAARWVGGVPVCEDHEYFTRYWERVAYPLAVNIVFHLMTH